MSILKKLGELFNVGFMSDSMVKKFAEGSGIVPAKDYKKQIAENMEDILEENKKTQEAMEELAKAISGLRDAATKDK